MSPSASDADRRLFERLVHETRDDLLAYALRRSASPEDAADVLSETYLIAWRKLEKIPPGEQARLWLFGVARNVIRQGVDRRRSRDALVERIAREVRAATHVEPALKHDRAGPALQAEDGQLQVFDVWESQEAFDEFLTYLGPVMEELGIELAQPPTTMPIVDLVQQ